jgi:hypothetical protein
MESWSKDNPQVTGFSCRCEDTRLKLLTLNVQFPRCCSRDETVEISRLSATRYPHWKAELFFVSLALGKVRLNADQLAS